MSALIAIGANNNKIVDDVDGLKLKLSKFQKYQKNFKSQKFKTNFLNSNINNVFFNLNFNIRFIIINF